MTNQNAKETGFRIQDLRRSFEDAVQDVYQAGLKGKVSPSRSPIAQRPKAAPESRVSAEKRALSDAARALAQLWKLPQTSSR